MSVWRWSGRWLDGEITRHIEGGSLDSDGRVASVWGASLLEEPSDPPVGDEASGALVIGSGWFGEQAEPGVFERDPRIWMADARTKSDAGIAAVVEAVGDRAVWVWPHARHVLSDIPSCLTAANGWARDGGGLGLLVEPTALLTRETAEESDDHLIRIFDALAVHERTVAVVLSGVRAAESDPDALVPVALGDGLVSAELIVRLWRETGAAERVPVVLRGDAGQVAAQLELIG